MSSRQLEVLSLDEPLLDAEQAAAWLNVRPSWVRDATRAGRLPYIRVGRHLRYTQLMLEQWAVHQRIRGRDAPATDDAPKEIA